MSATLNYFFICRETTTILEGFEGFMQKKPCCAMSVHMQTSSSRFASMMLLIVLFWVCGALCVGGEEYNFQVFHFYSKKIVNYNHLFFKLACRF